MTEYVFTYPVLCSIGEEGLTESEARKAVIDNDYLRESLENVQVQPGDLDLIDKI